jgi:hypothetical protein
MVQIVGTLLALALLYVLSVGPVMYLRAQGHLQRFGSRALPSFPKIYNPLLACVSHTPLEMKLYAYRMWCLDQAIRRAADREQRPRR